MKQASRFDGLSFDPFSLLQDGLALAVIDIGRGEVGQTLMIAMVVVMVDEGADLALQVAGHLVVFQQDAVLESLKPAFHDPAVHCAAMSREGSCLGSGGGVAPREHDPCPCSQGNRPDQPRRKTNRYR